MFQRFAGLGLIILALFFFGDASTSCIGVLLLLIGGFLLLRSKSNSQEIIDRIEPPSRSSSRRSSKSGVTAKVTINYASRESSFSEMARKYVNSSGKPCLHVPFKSYWPTYSDMNKAQQEYYFYWRSQVRNGRFPDTSLSYIFLHVYELINNVGVRNIDDGYRQLRTLWLKYHNRFPELDNYLPDWIVDYLVVNRYLLDPLLFYAEVDLQPILAKNAPDLVLSALVKENKPIWEMPLSLIDSLTDYNIQKSKFYQSGYADVVEIALRQALKAAETYLQTKGGQGIFERFGPKRQSVIKRTIFQSALYIGEQTTITIAQVYPYSTHSPFRKFLTGIVKHTENLLRQHYGFTGRLKVTDLPSRMANTIEAAISLPTNAGIQVAEFELPDTGGKRAEGVAIPERAGGVIHQAPSKIPIPSAGNLKIVSNQYLSEAHKRATHKVKPANFVPLDSPFTSYSHDYQFLNKGQQNWYFYWRDQVRQGQYPATDLAYIFIHAQELVHLVGASDPDDAYKQLRALWLNYRGQHPKIEPYLLSWILSLITVYDCEVSACDVLCTPEAFDFTVSYAPDVLLMQYINGNLREVPIALLEKYVDHNIQRSSFYMPEHESLVQRVIPAAIDLINKHHANNGNGSLFAQHSGVPVTIELKRCWRADQTYLDWPTQLYFEDVPGYSKNQKLRRYLTNIVKYTENKLRDEKGFRGRLQVQGLDQGTQRLIDQLISHNGHVISPPPTIPKIEIDLSKVEQLRAESEEVLSMLQVEEEEKTEESIPTPKPSIDLQSIEPVTETSEQEPIIDTENVFESEDEIWKEFAQALEPHQAEALTAIFNGTDPKAAIRNIAMAQFLMPTMLIDSINELAQDILGDILIESADEPRLVDDSYAPMVSQIIKQGRS